MKNIVVYAHSEVSCMDIERQIRSCKYYVRNNYGLGVDEIIVDGVEDACIDRVGIRFLLERAECGEHLNIFIDSVLSIEEQLEQWMKFVSECNDHNINLYSTTYGPICNEYEMSGICQLRGYNAWDLENSPTKSEPREIANMIASLNNSDDKNLFISF